MLEEFQKQFLDLVIENRVLQFGRFKLKSGRISPYFFNAGLINTGESLGRLGDFYAEALARSGIDYDMLFGPAYKGIPLVSTTAIAVARREGRPVPWAFNRKEVKDHGEGGRLVGAPIQGKVVIVDDVITAGTAIREVMEILEETDARVVGILVAIDRQERGTGKLSAFQEVERDYGVHVINVIALQDIIEYVRRDKDLAEQHEAIEHYRGEYGIVC